MLQGSFATGLRSRLHPAVREMRCVSKRFYDTFTGTATGAARCGFLLKRVLVSWLLSIDEHGGHKDLCDLGCQSIIPYVHGRTELYFTSLPIYFLALTDPREEVSARAFYIAQGRVVTLRPGAREVAPRWLKSYTTSRVIMARSSK
jgi:hypothetical protein